MGVPLVCQTLGGSIIVGASSLAGIVESPLPKVLSQSLLSMLHSACIGCLGLLSLKVKVHTLSRVKSKILAVSPVMDKLSF